MKKVILCGLFLSLLSSASFAKEKPATPPPPIDSKNLDIEFCEETANLFGYLMTASASCKYTINKGWMNHYTDTNKKCIAKFGQDKIYNTTMAAVHEAKNDLATYERGDMCSGIYKAYKGFF